MNKMKPFSKTKSLCPVCKKIIEASIVEKNDSMFIQKKCSEHGDFEAKVAKHAWYYKGLNSYYDNIHGADFYKKKKVGIYTSIVSASRCNLNCPVCFTPPSKKEEKDISIDFFREQLEKIKNKKVTIRLSGGGEPTLKEDLPDLIRLVAESGNAAGLGTNGVKIANDFNYLMKLKKSGLRHIYIWLDALKNEEIHRKMRGGDFIELKMRALENIKKAKIPVELWQVVARGINESEIGDGLEFVRKNEFISTRRLRGYSFSGKCGLSPDREFGAVDELVEVAASQSRGLFTLEDAYYIQKINYVWSVFTGIPRCYVAQVIFIPRNKEKSLRDTFCFEKFSKVLDEFEKIWQEDPARAKIYFLSKYFSRLITNPRLFYVLTKKKISGFSWNDSMQKYYCAIIINPSHNLLNCDVGRIQQQCSDYFFNLGPENCIPDCYGYLQTNNV